MKMFNTLKRKKEEFKPLKSGVVTMYNCGLTVYNYNHIGNLRTAMFADTIRRYLEYKGLKVKQVMNFTDVGHMAGDVDASISAEDKMAAAAKREKMTVWDVANFYIRAATEDYKQMNFEEPDVRPRATEHINDIIAMVQKLIENSYAYVANGSVYFDISKFKDYGKLSGNTIKELEVGAGGRVEHNPDKKNQLDFALWVNDPEHVMHWISPWSTGYPGWHIECSVMSSKYLGDTIDIHTGGEDNKFPHHECEIAQSEGASGKKFVKYWMHVKHLMVDGEKMSKSKSNFYTLRDIIKKGYSAGALRYLFLGAQYRSQMNFTWASMDAAEKTVKGLLDFIDRLEELKAEGNYNDKLKESAEEARKKFEEGMDDDFNTPAALAAMQDLARDTNKAIEERNVSKKNLKEVRELMKKFDKVLGILERKKEEAPTEIQQLMLKREEMRLKKDWKKADEIRNLIKEKGWLVEDSPNGPRLKKA